MKKNDVVVKVNPTNRQVYFNDNFLGLNAENLQSNLVFEFDGEFVNGTPRVEVEKDGNKYIITEVSKVNDTYVMEIKSSLLNTINPIYMQLVVTEVGDEEIPIFKSKMFYLIIGESINADKDLPDEYETLYEQIQEKIAEASNLDIDANKVEHTATVTITDRYGTQKSVAIYDGDQGETGNGIINVAKTSTSGLVDTYTINYTNGNTNTYNVTNGADGDDYVITQQDYNAIAGVVETDLQPTIGSIENTANTANNTANTAKSIAEGANQALSYNNYLAMITAFNSLDDDVYRVGQNVYIQTRNVPDLWAYSVESTSVPYQYSTDETFVNELATNGYVQVGYYKLSALETQKVDLTDYVAKTTTIAGVDLQDNITKSELQTALDIDDKLDKNSTTGAPNYHGMVYGINTAGTQEMIPLARANRTANAIPRYDAGSDLFVSTTQKSNDSCVTNVGYVNGRTTSLTGTSAPTTSTEASFVGQIYLDTTNNNTYQCTAITTEDNVTTYTWVKLIRGTDYATSSNGGIVIADANYGVQIGTDYKLRTVSASNAHINARSSDKFIISPYNLDYAVKVGVTTNVNTLTDTEKTNACNWLGTSKVVYLTQSAYDDLVDAGTVDSNTEYNIYEEE